MSNLCDLGATIMRGNRFDGTDTFRNHLLDGTDVGQGCAIGTFAERTTVSVDSAIKIDKDLPFAAMCLLGCGVSTGWGSVVYSAETKPGDVIIIAGVGGVGINAVQGASHVGAGTIIAVDPVEFKRKTALELGATHAFATIAEAADFARSITNGQGADQAILTIGVVRGEHVAEAIRAIRKAGTVVITGISPGDEASIPVNPVEITLMQKRVQGSLFGACNPRAEIPRQIEMYRRGQLKLDELITRTYKLDDIGQAFEDLNDGVNIRGVITFD